MLLTDSISKPLFDRGLQALYPPGSPFKLINGLIGLQEKVITKNTQFKCNKGHFYARGSFMECLCGDNLRKKLHNAIYKSCNTYFAKTFTRIGRERGWPQVTLERFKAQNGPTGALMIGNPEEIAEKILRHSEALGGISRFTFQMDNAELSHKQLLKSIELIGEKIKPIIGK